ncbi:MAG: hypothetical protein AABW47_00770 [Nanoarchaeota archaeon]
MNDEILGGLKSALERGESLKRAMMTFFNAGYKREEIEEAARNLNAQGIQPSSPSVTTSQQSVNLKPDVPLKQIQSLQTNNQLAPLPPVMPEPVQYQQQTPAVKQNVSGYEEESKGKALIFILIGILVFLLGTLLAIFIFKNELINFFSSFFA